jgi:hydrogenase/urease accessory protein HupE
MNRLAMCAILFVSGFLSDVSFAHKLDPARLDLVVDDDVVVGTLHIPEGWETRPELADGTGCSLAGPVIRCSVEATCVQFDGLVADQQVFVFDPNGELLGSLSARSPAYVFQDPPTLWSSVWLGVVHVLIGWDHVAFLLLLLLWIRPLTARLVAISAFTVGHSITLCAVAFGFTPWSSGATELLIALSVVLLAAETWGGVALTVPSNLSLACLVSGVGLIHGLGFGGVLIELASTRDGVVSTLFGFNIGIEIGQIALFLGWWGIECLGAKVPERVSVESRRAVNILGGTLGAYWTLDRLVGWLTSIS